MTINRTQSEASLEDLSKGINRYLFQLSMQASKVAGPEKACTKNASTLIGL